MKKPFLLAVAASVPLLLGACSTSETGPMDTGERISQRGGEIGAHGEAWSDGQDSVRQGQKLVEKSSKNLADGEKDLARAREQVAKAEARISAAQADRSSGEQMIEGGTGQMRQAEAGYTAIRTGPAAVGTSQND